MDWHPNAYTFWYQLKAIILPAMLTILPIVVIGRFAFGKYKEKKLEDSKIEIKGDGTYESLRLQMNDLLFIQSSDNYVNIYFLNGSSIKNTLIRTKLSTIEDAFPELVRTHRSYIVNPYHFQSWKSEKGKHSLKISEDFQVPISKTYLEQVKRALEL